VALGDVFMTVIVVSNWFPVLESNLLSQYSVSQKIIIYLYFNTVIIYRGCPYTIYIVLQMTLLMFMAFLWMLWY